MTTTELEPPTASTAAPAAGSTMMALVHHGPGKRAWETRPTPNDILTAYEVFGNAASEGALKVVLKNDRAQAGVDPIPERPPAAGI